MASPNPRSLLRGGAEGLAATEGITEGATSRVNAWSTGQTQRNAMSGHIKRVGNLIVRPGLDFSARLAPTPLMWGTR
jgi:hypothetical protein